jgi:hypothetical protein
MENETQSIDWYYRYWSIDPLLSVPSYGMYVHNLFPDNHSVKANLLHKLSQKTNAFHMWTVLEEAGDIQ